MNNRGLILLEVMISIVIVAVSVVEMGRLFSTLVSNRTRLEVNYLELFAARKRLLLVYDTSGLKPGLTATSVAPGLVKIIDNKTGLWLYRYESAVGTSNAQ